MLNVFAVLAMCWSRTTRRFDTAVGRATGHSAVGRAAGMGRRAKRSQVRLERTEAGSSDSFGNDAFLSCRIESPSIVTGRTCHLCTP